MTPLRPRALQKGDLVGVCAPSGPLDGERLRAGVTLLERLGYRVRADEGLLQRSRLNAGSVARRVAELHSLAADDEVAAILCARGGAGAGWLLGHLDPDVFRSHPKIFLGYSDATFLHLFLGRLGIPTFYGPMVAVDLPEILFDAPSLWGALEGGGRYRAEIGSVRSGAAEGILRGGCLSILASACGTPYALEGLPGPTILFLEDVDEPPYQIDRMLYQLRESGALRGVTGVVFGEMKGCGVRPGEPYTLKDVVQDALEGLDVPIAWGLPSGHTTGPTATLPFGVAARLACGESAHFEILEDAVL
jgi:muramoyltetrapeptide carboxypeptidase